MSIFQLPPSRCPCKEFLISWFLPPNNLGGKKSVKFFWKCKFRVYNAVSSLGIGVRKRVTRYNWHGIKPHAVSICHFSQKAKNQLHARCHINSIDVVCQIGSHTVNIYGQIGHDILEIENSPQHIVRISRHLSCRVYDNTTLAEI